MLSLLTRVPERLVAPPVITPLISAIFWFVIMLHSFNIEILQTYAFYNNSSVNFAYDVYAVSLGHTALIFFLLGLVMVIKTLWDMLELFRTSVRGW